MKIHAYFSFGWRFSGYSLNLNAMSPQFVIEKVNKFSTDIIKVSSSTSNITDRRHTPMHDTHPPLIGTCVNGDKSWKVLKNSPSFASEYSNLDYPIILMKAEAVIPRKAHR